FTSRIGADEEALQSDVKRFKSLTQHLPDGASEVRQLAHRISSEQAELKSLGGVLPSDLNLPSGAQSAVDALKSNVKSLSIPNSISVPTDINVPSGVRSAADGLESGASRVGSGAGSLAEGAGSRAGSAIGGAATGARSLADGAGSRIGSAAGGAASGARSAVDGVKSNLPDVSVQPPKIQVGSTGGTQPTRRAARWAVV
ncbi:MAG: hypothetical protein Q9159_007672, partial [Coniocarpon cinnabarinum]